ncbi:hypothetical protein MVEN_02192100 [Mycena venus]|uniref:Transposase domain-containing protein n=1 Tax=Mycena venus TaxID=2733690 RepID=A0A8H7CFH3_9AGAR|nr:hypothetical protein MVEN_02192100 [Mycena venus]
MLTRWKPFPILSFQRRSICLRQLLLALGEPPSPTCEEMDIDEDDSDSDDSDPLASECETVLELGEEDEWLAFDEGEERQECANREEMARELEQMLDAEDEAVLWDIRNETLSEQDRDNFRAFQLKMISNMPHLAFAQMRYSFRHKLQISSHYVMIHRIAVLSGVMPQWYHCCSNSCMAYTGVYSELTQCRHCGESRFASDGRPRRLFCYLPLIPRLQGYFMSPQKVQQLLYRHNYKHKSGTIADVFDGEHYRNLCKKKVVVDGKELPHNYFSGKNDIALSICTDSYLLFDRRRKGPSATAILAKNYNIVPESRTHLGDLMNCGVIPGPKPPKDIHSFLVPLDDELACLAIGVQTYDSLTRTVFDLHAYNLYGHGDIIAAEKMLNVKGHNSRSPCRSCQMKGVRCNETIYYIPLSLPCREHEQPTTWDPRKLPLRTHAHFLEVIQKIDIEEAKFAHKRKEDKLVKELKLAPNAEKLAKFHGIKGLPVLRRVGSMDFARSYPWDLMHLFFENIIPNLVSLWKGTFKGLDSGREDYELSEEVWEEIWKETTEATSDIPAAFSRSLAAGPSKFTAEAWFFWFVYLAPTLLQGRFSDPKYHTHACDLAEIIKKCIQFVITTTELDKLEENIISWVRTYEREDRLCACPLVIHGMLHIVSDIRFCGPSWTTWTFYMERYCGFLKAGLRSRVYPWSNLNNRALNYTYLEQIGVRYDLSDELELYGRRHGLSNSEKSFANYPHIVLRYPVQKTYQPDDDLTGRIAAYFGFVFSKPTSTFRSILPKIMPSWGKLRILGGGDSIRSASAPRKGPQIERNSSYVRYEVKVLQRHSNQTRNTAPNTTQWITQISYGRLEEVLACKVPKGQLWGAFSRGNTVTCGNYSVCN